MVESGSPDDLSHTRARIGGRFELLDPIGAGPSFRRHAAVDADGSRCVVTVFVGAPEPGFEEHMPVLTRLEHPNLIPVLSAGIDEESGRGYLAEPEVRGRCLANLLAPGEPLEAQGVLRMALQIAEGLSEAHRRGVVHGALAPTHVMLVGRGAEITARIGGFGVQYARLEPERVEPADLLLLSYRAPEQALGTGAVAVSDAWALGVLVYHALTGAPPRWDAKTASEWLAALAERTIGDLGARAPWLEPEIVGLVQAALGRDPDRRPDVRELARRLRALAPGREPLNLNMLSTVPPERRSQVSSRRQYSGEAATISASDRLTPSPTSHPDRMIGAMIDGRWEIVRLIGEGGMGAVYEGRDPDGRVVAVKLIRRGSDDDEGFRRFLRESRSALELESPNIVRVLAAGVDQPRGTPFMVMDMLHGSDLAETISKLGPLDPAAAARVFVDACAGLEVAHAAGMVHRDLKPSNLFLHEEAGAIVPKICDFGIVKRASVTEHQAVLTQTGFLLGSPAYMSPEQARDPRSVDGRSDVWSMGMALYEALSGRLAWADWSNIGELIVKLYTSEVVPLQDVAPWIHPELATVVHRALARDPELRFSSARELGEALVSFAAPAPLTAAAVRAVASDRRGIVAPRAPPTPSTTAHPLQTAVPQQSPPPRRVVRWAGTAALVLALASVATWRVLGARQQRAAAALAAGRCVLTECRARNGGQPSRCRPDGRCVALETEQCKVLADEKTLASVDAVWLGAMFPTSDSQGYMADFGTASLRAVDLARRDFMSVTGGLPPKKSGGTARPIGVVACDDSVDAAAVARHLVMVVGVPAVIGFRASNEVIELANGLFIPQDVLAVPALNQSALITSIPHPAGKPRLVWRTAVTTKSKVVVLGAVVRDFAEPRVRVAGNVTSDIRLALLRGHDSVDLAISEGLFDSLQLNGKSAADNGARFREIDYEDAKDKDGVKPSTVQDVLRFQPQVIILGGTNDKMMDRVIAPLESAWPANAPRPLYIAASTLEGDGFARLVSGRTDFGSRIFGLSTPSKTSANLKFTSSYNATFGAQLSPALSPGAPYDSFYLLAYAAYLADDPMPTGSDLARAIARLSPPGTPMDVGPGRILDAFGALQRGEAIDLKGAYSRLDFDVTTGESSADYAILCAVRAGDPNGSTVDNIESGLIYDAGTRKLSGTFDCPAPK